LRAIEDQGSRNLEAIERSQFAMRDGFRGLAESLDRVGTAITRSIEQQEKRSADACQAQSAAAPAPAPAQSLDWHMLVTVISVIAALMSPGYMWISNINTTAERESAEAKRAAVEGVRQLQDEVHAIARDGAARDEQSMADRRDLRTEQVAQRQKLEEIETQFRAIWMLIDNELQMQDRVNSFLWNAQHHEMPWEPRRYYPSMDTPAPTGALGGIGR
jgi:hypothetical protein